jgi:hypothetical protein
MDKDSINVHFMTDVDEIVHKLTELDIQMDSGTFQEKMTEIRSDLDKLVQTKTNLDALLQIFS